MDHLPPKADRSSVDRECRRLRLLLADQIEKNLLAEARETIVALLGLSPGNADALSARELIEDLADSTAFAVGEIRQLLGHQNAVNAVAISPDGRLALSGGGTPRGATVFRSRLDYSVRLWELKTGRELRSFSTHTAMVTAVAFSPDGQRALSAAQDGSTFVWEVETGQVVARVGKRLPHVFAVAFAADGRQVFTATSDRVVRLWDLASGERVNRYVGHRHEVTALALSPDGKQLLTGCQDGQVWLWDVASGKRIRRTGGHSKCVYGVAISPDGSHGVSGGADFTARIWDLNTGTEVQVLAGHTYTVCGVAFAPDGKSILTAGDVTVRLWDATTGKQVNCFAGHTDSARSVAFTPDSQRALSASRDGTVRYWQLFGEDRVSASVPVKEQSVRELPALVAGEWVNLLRRSRVLDADWERELVDKLAARLSNPRELLPHLVDRGWLTDYQVRQLAEQRGRDLRFGDYVLLEPLGQGGRVFKARRWGTADQVALKLLPPGTDPAALAQFTNEIQAAARLNHLNVVRTYETGMENGRPFVATEWLEGSDFARLVAERGPIPVERACQWIRQAAFGLDHAYEHSLVHRDLKPASLFLTCPNPRSALPGLSVNWVAETAIVKILDWGVARLRGPWPLSGRYDLLDGPSVDYLAPEQLAPGTADVRSDVYSLGYTLYYLLAGKPPFDGCTTAEKLSKHRDEYPAPLSAARPDVPSPLEAVMRKMIDKDPNQRFRTPGLIVAALRPFCPK